MSNDTVIRAWKDNDHPANPAGLLELTDEALNDLIAGAGAASMDSCCWNSCNGPKKPEQPTT